ncbi:MAG: hypothetical protein ACTSWY_02140 [Promethearchaeota archaeon]
MEERGDQRKKETDKNDQEKNMDNTDSSGMKKRKKEKKNEINENEHENGNDRDLNEDINENHEEKASLDENYEEIIVIDDEEGGDKIEDFDFLKLLGYNGSEEPIEEAYGDVKSDYPSFFQVLNGCGLSSMLMLLDPIKNKDLGEFLDQIWNGVEKILLRSKKERKEFEWSYVLEYLLIKSFSDNIISDYLEKTLQDYYVYRINSSSILKYFMQNHIEATRDYIAQEYLRFFETGIINSFILDEHISIMKHNSELNMLFEIFGYESIPYWEGSSSAQPTGALWFSEEELQNLKDPDVVKKLKILKNEFDRGAKILWGKLNHWLAVTDIIVSNKIFEIVVNDPLTGMQEHIKIQSLSEEDQLYFFKKKKINVKPFWAEIIKFLKKEFEKEQVAFLEFRKNMQNAMRQKVLKTKIAEEISLEDLEEIPEDDSEIIEEIPVEIKESNILSNSDINTIIQKDFGPGSEEKRRFNKKIREIIKKNFSF